MKKKVFLIVPTLIGHGQERMAVLAAESVKNEYDVSIIVFTEKNLEYQTTAKLISLHLPAKENKIGKLIQIFRRAYKLKQLRKNNDPICVISFGTSANFVNVLSKGYGKTIVSFRGFASIKKAFDFKYTCRKADEIFCISQGMCDHISMLYPQFKDKIYKIYNGADINGIIEKSKYPNDFFPSSPSFVSVGRLEDVKGFRHLIQSFNAVQKKIPSATLIIIGEGSIHQELQELIDNLHLSNHISLIGSKKNPFSYLSKCDICVQTSISEGFLNVIVEAFACGVPVISTDCKSGPREILSTDMERFLINEIELAQNGILVPAFTSDDSIEPKKEELLAKAMILLAEDRKLRGKYQENGRIRMQEFSVEHYKNSFLALLERAG